MNLQDAIKAIHSPKGFTSVIEALLGGGDARSIEDQNALGKGRADAEAALAKAQKAQNECKSDAAYWGYMGDVCYWRAVVNIIKAAELVGPDNLPDVPLPQWGGVVMDE